MARRVNGAVSVYILLVVPFMLGISVGQQQLPPNVKGAVGSLSSTLVLEEHESFHDAA